jgi:hypothetical protein
MHMSNLCVAGVALCAGIALTCFLRGGDRSEVIYPEATQQSAAGAASADAAALVNACRADFARFSKRRQKLRALGASTGDARTNHPLTADLNASADEVTAKMNAVDAAFNQIAAGNHAVAAQRAVDEAVANFHEAHEFFNGVAARWEALPQALAPK